MIEHLLTIFLKIADGTNKKGYPEVISSERNKMFTHSNGYFK